MITIRPVGRFPLKSAVTCCLCVSLLLTAISLAAAQDIDPEREKALHLLWKESRTEDALPLLEKVAAANPNDGQVLFSLGFALLGHAKLVKNAEERKQTRIRARQLLVEAKELGINDPLLLSMLEALRPDGGPDDMFSRNADADAAMREGEAAFLKGQFATAAAAYERALTIDPKLYEAALFAGDMYFKLDQLDKSEAWYARAIQINPDRETAYRYSATPFLTSGKLEQARTRYVEAVIAEPYNRLAWRGLAQWADRAGVVLDHPKIEIPTSVTEPQNNSMTITLDPKVLDNKKGDTGSSAWVIYGLTRASWSTSEFKKAFPDEPYRHSLQEEAAALLSVVAAVKDGQKRGEISQLDPSLANLIKLTDEGLLEPYILFVLVDKGIAQDYPEYRKTNRDKLRRYLMEYVTAKQ